MSIANPMTSTGRLRHFRVLAINGEHIAIAGDYNSWQEAVDARREKESQLDREDPTWFDITPLPEIDERKACMALAPDFSGRNCNKPHGHEGDHWTYGGAALAWKASN